MAAGKRREETDNTLAHKTKAEEASETRNTDRLKEVDSQRERDRAEGRRRRARQPQSDKESGRGGMEDGRPTE